MRQANLKQKKPPGTLAKFKSFTPAFTPTQPKETNQTDAKPTKSDVKTKEP